MLLNEDLFELDVPDAINTDIDISEIDSVIPEAGPKIGVENLLMQSIKDVYGMIEGYNSLSIALTDLGDEDSALSIADIITQEHANIGTLQNILKKISPNAENMDAGE